MGVIRVDPKEGNRTIQRINRRIQKLAKDYGTESYIYKEFIEGIQYAYGSEQVRTNKHGEVYLKNTRANQAVAVTDPWTRRRAQVSVQEGRNWVNEYWDKRDSDIVEALTRWSGQNLASMTKEDRTAAIRNYMSQISIVDKEIEELLSEYYSLVPEEANRMWTKLGNNRYSSTLPEKLQFLERLQAEIASRRQLRGESFSDVLKELQERARMNQVNFGITPRVQTNYTNPVNLRRN